VARYVFYDTETTGTDTVYDQILQFGAVLTDSELNELDRFEVRSRLLPHVVPAPGALLANRLSPATLVDPALPTHYEALRLIAAKLECWSPAVFLGYNSIEFDEKLLRQSLYQTLQPVYVTNTRGNVRADVLRLVQAATTLAPQSLSIPLAANGKETRKLDAIAPANGFNHANAHDAMADVKATIFMAKLVKTRAPRIWSALMGLAPKPAAISCLRRDDPLMLTEFYGGRPYSWPVIGCGCSPDSDTLGCVFDLRFDPSDFLRLSENDLVSVLLSPRKALRYVATNKQPILIPFEIAPASLFGSNLSKAEFSQRAKTIRADREFCEKACRAVARRFSTKDEPAQHVEEQIYDAFPCSSDAELMRQFHLVPWDARIRIVDRLQDQRFRELGYRLIHVERPDVLAITTRSRLDAWHHERVLGTPGVSVPYRTFTDAIREAEDLARTGERESAHQVYSIKKWLEQSEDRLTRSRMRPCAIPFVAESAR
jgi:exodeoxyribonuclease-1